MKNKIALMIFFTLASIQSKGQLKVYIPLSSNYLYIDSPLLNTRYLVRFDSFQCYVLFKTVKGSGVIDIYDDQLKRLLMKCNYIDGDILCKEARFVEYVLTGKNGIKYLTYYFPKIISFNDFTNADTTSFKVRY
jgi:hypothetical protein